MDITSYTRDKIQKGINEARERSKEPNENIRMLLVPERIDEENFDRACDVYSRLEMANYDTVVVVESYEEKLDKKLPMASNSFYKTSLGQVQVDDYLRNELCDEDDDFFIHDEAFGQDISLFQQLMFLQVLSDNFEALSVQIADKDPAIIKELAYVLEEVLASRNSLLIFCCELDNDRQQEFEKVLEILEADNKSGLMNYLNSGESHIKGTTAFIAGIIVAEKWDLNLQFLKGEKANYSGSLLTAYADRRRIIF
jgi:AmmeMemoRadiSam system protein B